VILAGFRLCTCGLYNFSRLNIYEILSFGQLNQCWERERIGFGREGDGELQ
jgi:hypothetical protein